MEPRWSCSFRDCCRPRLQEPQPHCGHFWQGMLDKAEDRLVLCRLLLCVCVLQGGTVLGTGSENAGAEFLELQPAAAILVTSF